MPDIRHCIQIAAPPEAVYPLVASGPGFTRWWAEDVTDSGAAVELGFFGRATIYRLRLQANEPPARAEWLCETGAEWSGTRISFHLEARGAVTVLRFSHAGWASETEYFISCNTTWGELIFRLKAAAEAKSRGPLFRANEMAY